MELYDMQYSPGNPTRLWLWLDYVTEEEADRIEEVADKYLLQAQNGTLSKLLAGTTKTPHTLAGKKGTLLEYKPAFFATDRSGVISTELLNNHSQVYLDIVLPKDEMGQFNADFFFKGLKIDEPLEHVVADYLRTF